MESGHLIERDGRLFRRYKDTLTATINAKGVLDVDTVKGCTAGMNARPDGGCYNACYAAKIANFRGIDFTQAVTRRAYGRVQRRRIEAKVASNPLGFFRIGTMGDPCHDWEATVETIEWLSPFAVPVVITKHWMKASDEHVARMVKTGAVLNTSISALDTDSERKHRIGQFWRYRLAGGRSVARIVSAKFNRLLPEGLRMGSIQDELWSLPVTLDNPLRISAKHQLVVDGVVEISPLRDLGDEPVPISLERPDTYLGHCSGCPDQCGATTAIRKEEKKMEATTQLTLLANDPANIEFLPVASVIGSGYEEAVARLAIEDKIAMRAARKNMQIHSAIILLAGGEFAGFMTFQKNHAAREFCLLQSVIRPVTYSPALYRKMVEAVIAQNVECYPAIITTDPKSKFETPKLFEGLGFQTYLKMSGFHYMVRGELADVRMKLLAHITMTNVWNTTKGDWLRLKREWNEQMEAVGAAKAIPNPTYATRDGCWQGVNGYSNVVNTKRFINEAGEIEVKTKAHNGNASVLDPVACEVILRFFMPTVGRRVYNPFGGGVQFGFVTGASGYEYVASEIRQNQCDANNALCSGFDSVSWVQGDSSAYEPDGMFDLIFTCPPYYKVEKYLDYDGKPPPGEINSCGTYEEFRDLLFSGYKQAIAHLKDNRFFVVMTGDSRDKNGAYYCSEAETEIFLKDQGLSVYNRIVYLECEFTRLAHAKRTLNYRKFPKREQKIIVAYKGDIDAIKGEFPPMGRL